MRATKDGRGGKTVFTAHMRRLCVAGATLAIGGAVHALAQDPLPQGGAAITPLQALKRLQQPIQYVMPLPNDVSTLYADGTQIEITQEERWRFMCGTAPSAQSLDLLKQIAANDHTLWNDNPPSVIIDNPRGTLLNVVYTLDASVPAAAATAIGLAETFIESQFGNPITITITVSYANLGGGIIGATNSSFVTNVSYAASRAGLVNGMDSDDTIQTWLPTGTTVPVRFDAATATITNKSTVDWTRANYRATVGSVGGNVASMQFNSGFSFDYVPSNGVPFSQLSFVDTMIHETGHAMGFVSAVDTGATNDLETLDLFRFQRTDGTGTDWNPDTLAEFQTTARTVDFDNLNDDANVDFITAEYRMADGNPYQASHFREQSANIGIMDPALAGGETRDPTYYSAADLAAFDAIGWDYPPCVQPTITQQPNPSQTACEGASVSLTVATSGASPTYQWRKGTTNLVNGGNISGATAATLTLNPIAPADEATDYNCIVTVAGCDIISNNASITVNATPVFTLQPETQTVSGGGDLFLPTAVQNPNQHTYRWYRNGSPLSDDGRIFNSAGPTLQISPVYASDAGNYTLRATTNGASCSLDSDVAVITVDCTTDAIVSQPPASQTVCAGSPVSISVVSGQLTPSYQWRKGTTNLVNGGNITGATSPTLNIANAQTGDAAANYNCVMTDTTTGCVVVSGNSAVVVNSPAGITGQPGNVTVNTNATINLSVTVTNPANYSYQWRKGASNLADGGRISGAASAALQITGAVVGDAGSYDVVITPLSSSCSVVSDAATVTVDAPPACPEDLNQNGSVDLTDLSILLTNFGSSGIPASGGDLNGDTLVNLTDLAQLLARFGTTCP